MIIKDTTVVTIGKEDYSVIYYYTGFSTIHVFPTSRKREDYLNYPITEIKEKLLNQLTKQ